MWELYPQRFIALLEHLITDGMTDDQLRDWNEELLSDAPPVDVNDPTLLSMVDMGIAADVYDAAELMRLDMRARLAEEEGKEQKAAQLQRRMTEINLRAKTGP